MTHGITIDSNDEKLENIFAQTKVSADPDLNFNEISDAHIKKARAPRESTNAGRQIDWTMINNQKVFVLQYESARTRIQIQ
jgi:hypothetical protein